MANKEVKASGLWNGMKILGIVIALFGLGVGVYSGYTLTSAPQGFAGHGSFANRTATVPANYTGTAHFSRGLGAGVGPYGIVIGVLALLLGVVLYKYAQLQVAVAMKK
jgi:hypothetical protein